MVIMMIITIIITDMLSSWDQHMIIQCISIVLVFNSKTLYMPKQHSPKPEPTPQLHIITGYTTLNSYKH